MTKKSDILSDTPKSSSAEDLLSHLAFDHSAVANIISITKDGKIIMVNSAVCKLLDYSREELLSKNTSEVFITGEKRYQKMLDRRNDSGDTSGLITAIKSNDEKITCEINSSVFTGPHGVNKATTILIDRSKSIRRIKQNATRRRHVVDENIDIALKKSDLRLTENNEWIKYIAKISYDVIWYWDLVTSRIFVGDTFEETFGYKVQNNIMDFETFCDRLLPMDEGITLGKMQQVIASTKTTWNDQYAIQYADGSLCKVISQAFIIRDNKGKAVHLIGATQDITRLISLEQKLEDRNPIKNEAKKILNDARLYRDIILDWDLTGDQYLIGKGFEGFSTRKSINQGNRTDWFKRIHPDDREEVETSLNKALSSTNNSWEDAFRFTISDNVSTNVVVRVNIFRQTNGEAFRMIGVLHELGRQIELEKRLERKIASFERTIIAYEEGFNLIFDSSSDVLFDLNLVTNMVTFNAAYEEEFGYKLSKNTITFQEFTSHIYQDDIDSFLDEFSVKLASTDIEWAHNFRFLKADGTIVHISIKGIFLRDSKGKGYRRIGFMQDVNRKIVLEEFLKKDIKQKEIQLEEAKLEAKNSERLDIGKELHDNINQLLCASVMYLDLAKNGGESSDRYLSKCSEYTQTAIEEIRQLSKKLTTEHVKNIGLCTAIESVIQDISETTKLKITNESGSFVEQSVNENFKINIFRIFQEHLTNVIKHAKANQVNFSILQNSDDIEIIIKDDGVGFDPQIKSRGIGLANIKSRVASYKGIMGICSAPGKGCVMDIKFPQSPLIAAEYVSLN